MHGYEQAQQAREYIQAHLAASAPSPAPVGLILGSGLSGLTERIDVRAAIPYVEIPHWPTASVTGHAGRLALANIAGTSLIVLAGRVHLYEGLRAAEVAFPVRVLAGLGVQQLIVTNAAGAIREDWSPGHLALISDHINLQGDSPLAGAHEERWGPRFPDMADAYSPGLREAARQAAQAAGIGIVEGVYAAVKGPNYETPAEIRYLKSIGADLVGMSTVPEVIAARQMGLEVLGISVISNLAAGLGDTGLHHDEVLAVGGSATERLADLIRGTLPAMAGRR
ncbi:MAG: purine-nucleoside phosphorylase [Acidobacteria bacterium]|nr:purine-nucleoside phosphorylase [Acidobacteriota bacterium]